MAKMIQVRNVRPEVHAELVRRARLKGKTLTAYIEELLEGEVERPPAEEVFEQVRARRALRRSTLSTDQIVAIIREMRGPLPPG